LNKPDITAADGVSVTGVGGFGSPFFGGSAAAPAAAAVAALVLSAKPTLTAAQMRTALTSTAVDIMNAGFDRDSGSGIVMAWEAIHSLGVAGAANPELGTISASENPGNGNGIIEAGEGASISIQLNNKGGVNAATGITATLTSSTPGVIVNQPGSSKYADMATGATGGNNLTPFLFTLASDFPCGQVADFTLTTNYTGGPQHSLNFQVLTGTLEVTNTLGAAPQVPSVITFATGSQVNRINRNGVISACGTPKAFPGAITGSHSFDSYTFQACKALCLRPGLDAGAAGVNLFEAVYSPSYNPASIGTNYQGDAGLSTNIQSFGINTIANTPYTVVVSDVAGNPLPAPAPPNTYTVTIPTCALSCTINHLPIAVAKNVTVVANNAGGTANANIDNGSSDPDGKAIVLTQTPPGPYPVGATSVILTATNTLGAANQATGTVTVENPAFTLAPMLPSVSVTAGKSVTEQVTFSPTPAITSPLTFACSGLPAATTCAFSPSSIAAGSTQTSVTVTISTTATKTTTAALARPRTFVAGVLFFTAPGLFGFILLVTPKRGWRKAGTLLPLLLIGLIACFAGCGRHEPVPIVQTTSPGTPQGTSTVTVTGTSGNVVKTATFTLTVN